MSLDRSGNSLLLSLSPIALKYSSKVFSPINRTLGEAAELDLTHSRKTLQDCQQLMVNVIVYLVT